MMEKNTDAPAWNIESEYPDLNSEKYSVDFNTCKETLQGARSRIARISGLSKTPSAEELNVLRSLVVEQEKITILLYNLHSYTNCLTSVDASAKEPKAKLSQLQDFHSEFLQVFKPLEIYLTSCEDSTMAGLRALPDMEPFQFVWSELRKLKPHLLSEGEEKLLQGLSVSGHQAWGNLYSELSGNIRATIKTESGQETMGLAKAHALIRMPDEKMRKSAWEGIQEAWTEHKDSSAAILNALAGWRHSTNEKRSFAKQVHFLDQPLWENRIQRETLDAMMQACRDNLPKIQKAPLFMAKILKKPKLDPWDLLAPCPVSKPTAAYSFAEAVELVTSAFAQVSDEFADFMKMMVRNRWIEGRILPNKTTGAYCTGFSKSLEPRVYMTFMGSNSDVSTLAHEVGHAYHSWVMRDLPRSQMDYPMTLAETASIFAETLLFESLIKKAKTPEEKIQFAWNDLEGAMSLLINIPARFEFEKTFYEKRQHRTLSSDELSELTDQAWTTWYGPTLSKNDKMFWAHKMHFSFAGTSFYNFPYTFGYLFGLSIYARKDELGKDFMKAYINILRDTGRMTAEELIQRHLGENIRRPEFWQKAINVATHKISEFEKLLN